eukprot:1147297-Pelagomonas_calceolata.AAC.2
MVGGPRGEGRGCGGHGGTSERDSPEWIAPVCGPDMFYCSLAYGRPLNWFPTPLRQSGVKAPVWLMRKCVINYIWGALLQN